MAAKKKVISLRNIKDLTEERGASRILIIDACRKSAYGNKGYALANQINQKAIIDIADYSSSESPIIILCSCSSDESSCEMNELSAGIFTEALHSTLSKKRKAKSDISLPEIVPFVHEEVFKLSLAYQPAVKQTPFISGNSISIFPEQDALDNLSYSQKAAMAEADARLKELRKKHVLWDMGRSGEAASWRLTWAAIEPVLKIYKESRINRVCLSGMHFHNVDFSGFKSFGNITFAHSSFSGTSFRNARLSNVDFFNCSFSECCFTSSELDQCNLSHASFKDTSFSQAYLTSCILDYSEGRDSNFSHTLLNGSSFRHVDYQRMNFSFCSADNADFTCAKLIESTLTRAHFSGATLTGINLYKTIRSNWDVGDAICHHVFLDEAGEERFPKYSRFHNPELSSRSPIYEEFSYNFKNGILPVDIALLKCVIDKLNGLTAGFEIAINGISFSEPDPVIHFLVASSKDRKCEAEKLFSEKIAEFRDGVEETLLSRTQREEREIILESLDHYLEVLMVPLKN